MIKYSVIIPVYNSEKTVARCLDSLTVQNREDVQIIVVNDGSQDGSEEIILQLAAKNPSIEYIYQDNAGVSRARNTGLDAAQGTYITFVDSDDYVTEDYFSVLDRAEDCDLLVFAHRVIGNVPDVTALFAKLQTLTTAWERLVLLLSSRRIMSPWDKRFRRSIIEEKSVRFIEGMSTGEDFNFCMAYAMHCNNIAIESEQIICNDVTEKNSLSRQYRPHLDQKMVEVFTQVAQTIRKSSQPGAVRDRLLSIADYLFVKHVFSCISEEFKQRKLSYRADRDRIHEICNCFLLELTADRVNLIHGLLRLALRWKLHYPFYLVSYWVKGRKYTH